MYKEQKAKKPAATASRSKPVQKKNISPPRDAKHLYHISDNAGGRVPDIDSAFKPSKLRTRAAANPRPCDGGKYATDKNGIPMMFIINSVGEIVPLREARHQDERVPPSPPPPSTYRPPQSPAVYSQYRPDGRSNGRSAICTSQDKKYSSRLTRDTQRAEAKTKTAILKQHQQAEKDALKAQKALTKVYSPKGRSKVRFPSRRRDSIDSDLSFCCIGIQNSRDDANNIPPPVPHVVAAGRYSQKQQPTTTINPRLSPPSQPTKRYPVANPNKPLPALPKPGRASSRFNPFAKF
ncbi:MAG: hypothetical protein M1819_002752 [Sarea resinae]|nr:MAG: hypothetical protein M1819_002752 [Sarea resinae]